MLFRLTLFNARLYTSAIQIIANAMNSAAESNAERELYFIYIMYFVDTAWICSFEWRRNAAAAAAQQCTIHNDFH